MQYAKQCERVTALTSDQLGAALGLELARGGGGEAEADAHLVDGQVVQRDDRGGHRHEHWGGRGGA